MKKYISLILSLMLFTSAFSFNTYADNLITDKVIDGKDDVKKEIYDDNEIVTFIVEVDGNPVLFGSEAAAMGTDFLSTDKAQVSEEALVRSQSLVLDSIKNKTKTSFKTEAVYTLLFNGFAVKGRYGDLKKIEAIDGVKNVCVSEDIVITPHLSETPGLIGTASEDLGEYTGKGQLVAVIDTEFDVKHSFFAAQPETPKFESADDMAEFLSNKEMSFPVSANQVFVNQKIPFAYDYGEGDYDLFNDAKDVVHGTHVAGIIGGKKGRAADGSEINGVAPDSQLVLMKVTNQKGAFNIASVFLALQDAVRLGVSVVNCSFGADYLPSDAAAIWDTNYLSARNAGVFITASAGNAARGFYRNEVLTDNIDYSASGMPAELSWATSVASSTKLPPENSQSSSFSSYGVTESLELKPEITAPGSAVYSSVPGDKYAQKSGTSMAAPHIAGVAAVMNEYFDRVNLLVTGTERNDLIENLMISTADVLTESETGVPFSSRVQGAGMVNAVSALKTPSVLFGNTGKSKISLGDGLTAKIDIDLNAKNLTDSPVTYDRLTLNVLTDGYKVSGEKTYISKSVALNIISHTLPESITLEAGEIKPISASITLDADELLENEKIFKNGFFIDGFISYENSSGEIPHVGIPFMGFYGDWTKAAVFDSTVYDEGGSTLVNTANGAYKTLLYCSETGTTLGADGAGGYDSRYIALSPNGDGKKDGFEFQFTPMRTISHIESSVKDKDGIIYEGPVDDTIYSKFRVGQTSLNDMTGFADGEYTVIIDALYNYEKENPTKHTIEIPFYIDTVVPEILSVSKNGNYLSVTAADDKYIDFIQLAFIESGDTVKRHYKYPKNPESGKEYRVTFNLDELGISDLSEEDIYIVVSDKAENTYTNSVSCLTGNIRPEIMDYTYLDGMYNISFDVLNYGNESKCSVIIAFYTASGDLVYLDKKNGYTLPEGASELKFKNFADLDSAQCCKLFFWDNMTLLTPADTCKTINLE